MQLNVRLKYKDDLQLIESIYEYQKDIKLFTSKVECFDGNAIKAYLKLLMHFSQEPLELPTDLSILTPEKLFTKLNEPNKILENAEHLDKYLVDLIEILVEINKCDEEKAFYDICAVNVIDALNKDNLSAFSVYIQMLHRLDDVLVNGIPDEMLTKIIAAAHSMHRTNDELEIVFTEAVLLIDSSLRKRHNQKAQTTTQLLSYIWNELCPSNIMKHQCDNCYAIISQLIETYLKECKLDEEFCEKFLTFDLWSFIRVAIESKVEGKSIKRRKQALFMLQKVLEMDSIKEIQEATSHHIPNDAESTEVVKSEEIWSNYFTVLETLLEVQFKLIITCLEKYLDSIVKYIPHYWSSIIFMQMLQHHNNYIIYLGVDFITKNAISLENDTNLMLVFYSALNNTYLYAEVKFSDENLANYLKTADVNHVLKIFMKINWQAVPLWTIMKSMNMLIESTQGDGIQLPLLFNYLKSSISQIKHMPQVDEFLISILRNVGFERFNIEQLLTLYELIPRREIISGCSAVLDFQKFEQEFIQIQHIAPSTKIAYFQHVIPNVKDQLKFLDGFYENNKNKIQYYSDYEYLLFDSMCKDNKSFYSALLVLKPRMYNLMKPQGNVTIDSLCFAVSLLSFIVEKYLDENNEGFTTYDSVKKIAYNFYELANQQIYVNPKKIELIETNLKSIDSKLAQCTELYPHKMEVLGILHDTALFENQPLNLVSILWIYFKFC